MNVLKKIKLCKDLTELFMINKKDKISVIMSVYNSEKTLVKCINSIINQTYQNFEFLIIDDFSTDNSLKICKEFELKNQSITVFENPKNLGLTRSLNKLLRHTKGKFIARQDADDFSEPERLETQMKNINQKNLDGCTTRSIVQNSSRVVPGFSYYLPLKLVLLYKNPFIHGSLLIKKSVIDDLGGYDERFIYAQDYKLMTDCIKRDYKIKIVNEKLYHLNMKDNISTKFKSEQKYYSDCVRKNIDPTK
tara:strand:- start:9492 stop:10238 length:747 start_codon:yes stop_codon:yes gene_type:complete